MVNSNYGMEQTTRLIWQKKSSNQIVHRNWTEIQFTSSSSFLFSAASSLSRFNLNSSWASRSFSNHSSCNCCLVISRQKFYEIWKCWNIDNEIEILTMKLKYWQWAKEQLIVFWCCSGLPRDFDRWFSKVQSWWSIPYYLYWLTRTVTFNFQNLHSRKRGHWDTCSPTWARTRLFLGGKSMRGN